MEFPAAAAQTAATGIPVYYRGEDAAHHLGLYHPPLYIYLLAGWLSLFGRGAAQVRIFGLVCVLLQGLLVLKILRALFGLPVVRRVGPWFWLLFLLNPYTIQTAGIADIDSTIYGPILCTILLVVLGMCWQDGQWRQEAPRRSQYVLLATMLTLAFWTKLTTVILVLPFIPLLLAAKLGTWRAIRAGTVVIISSIGVFLLTYFAYGRITHLDVRYTFAFTLMSLLERGSSGHGILIRLVDFFRNFRFMAPFMARWTGILPWLLTLILLLITSRQALSQRDKRALHYTLVLCLGLATTAYYCCQVTTFGLAPFKYTFVYWGLILSAPVLLVFGGISPMKISPTDSEPVGLSALRVPPLFVYSSVLLYVLAVFISRAWLKDYLLLYPYGSLQRPYSWILYIPVAAGLAGLGLAILRRSKLAKYALICAFIFHAGSQLGVAIYQANVDYSTTYDYGQTGFEDTVSFIRSNTGPEDVIAAMKDIGFDAQRRYYENYSVLYGPPSENQKFISNIYSSRVKYIVFTEERGQDQLLMNPSLRSWVRSHCNLIRSFGNYRVYELDEVVHDVTP